MLTILVVPVWLASSAAKSAVRRLSVKRQGGDREIENAVDNAVDNANGLWASLHTYMLDMFWIYPVNVIYQFILGKP